VGDFQPGGSPPGSFDGIEAAAAAGTLAGWAVVGPELHGDADYLITAFFKEGGSNR
jgi:hypothetical protein